MTKKVKTKYNTEFQVRAVSMILSSEKSTPQIAKDSGIKGTRTTKKALARLDYRVSRVIGLPVKC